MRLSVRVPFLHQELDKIQVTEGSVPKINLIMTDDLAADTYYFGAGDVLDWHRHPNGDQVFFFLQGSGTFHLQEEGGPEETVAVKAGSVVLAPRGVWHKVVNDSGEVMVAAQATKAGAGMEVRG